MTEIILNKWLPRNYQLDAVAALENEGYKKLLLCWSRRAGKDIVAWNLCIRQALKKVGVYFYLFPTYSQARKVIWNSITNSGESFLDFIPKEIIEKTNATELLIKLKNGSIIQLVGSDNWNGIMGTNPQGCVFSEFALQDPQAYQYIRPILAANGGWTIVNSTPRGRNSFYDLYQIAIQSDEWFVSRLTVDDTQHISRELIEREIESGECSFELSEQEYFCSFSMGVEGSYYSRYIDKMKLDGRIGIVPWEPGFAVNTCWDLGMRDSTVIIFFQAIGQTIRIMDCYENSKVGLEHYVNVIKQKEYTYNKHFLPHDVSVRELGTGMSRMDKLKQLGIKATIADNIGIMDGIECVRSNLSKIWIDERNCKPLIKALENYRQEFDLKRKVYKDHPLHDHNSHWADSMRYLCISLPKTRDGLTPQKLEQNYREAMLGNQAPMPAFFRDQNEYTGW